MNNIRSINQVILVGRLGSDAEVRQNKTGKNVARFSLATTSKGIQGQKTQWHSCLIFGQLADKLGQYLTKGSLVSVIGSISYRTDEQSGKSYTDIIVDDVQLLSGKQTQQQSGETYAPAAAEAEYF